MTREGEKPLDQCTRNTRMSNLFTMFTRTRGVILKPLIALDPFAKKKGEDIGGSSLRPVLLKLGLL